MPRDDYYQLLGISQNASIEDVKRAFRLKARACHPDIAGETSKDTFHALHLAYDTLVEPELRAKYDALRAVESAMAQVKRRRATRVTRFQSIYKMSQSMSQPETSVLKPVRATFVLSFEEALYGAHRDFWVERWQNGKVACKERIKVNIPPGWSEQKMVQAEGLNEKGEKRPVHLSLKLEPHPDCEICGYDIYFSLYLYPWDLLLGGKWPCPLFREAVMMTVPPNSRPDLKLRAKQLGLPQSNGQRGDLWVILKLRWPDALTEEQQGLMRHFALTFRSSS